MQKSTPNKGVLYKKYKGLLKLNNKKQLHFRKKWARDFPVVQGLRIHLSCRGCGFDPWSGN